MLAFSLNPIIIQNWIKKNASKVPKQSVEKWLRIRRFREIQDDLLSICLEYFQIISQVPKDWKIQIKQFFIGWYSNLKFVKYWYTYFLSPK